MKPTCAQREQLGLELARARLDLPGVVSQRRIAKEARVHHSVVGDVEAGVIQAPQRVLRVYARLCNFNANELFLSWGHMPEAVAEALQRNPALCEVILQAA